MVTGGLSPKTNASHELSLNLPVYVIVTSQRADLVMLTFTHFQGHA